jgi:DNA invertase Pin-like site-specific DNA recombinase
MTVYGYARVSTDGQSLTSQDAELHAAGCAKVYAEKISGARSNRPELAKVLKRLDVAQALSRCMTPGRTRPARMAA